ncbi:MAG: response regulator transcription factor [Prevotella sp.]|nr:response regulator transcription factor [Prevotella sp.]
MENKRFSPAPEVSSKYQPSEREIDILKAMAEGYTSKEIAQKMFISENTVEAHRKSLFNKLGARNVANLIYKAIEMGYIQINK